MTDKLHKLITEAEILADMLTDKAEEIKNYCRQAKATISGTPTTATGEVSTSPKDIHLERIVQDAMAKSRARRKRPNPL